MSLNPITYASYIASIAVFLGSFLFFYSVTEEIGNSFVAAVFTGALMWMSYVLVRWVILAFRK